QLPTPSYGGGGSLPVRLAAMSAATTLAAASANTPALAIGRAARSPSAYTSGNLVTRLGRSTDTQPSTARPELTTTSGTRWTGMPMNRSYGTLSPLASRASPAATSRLLTSCLG